MSITIVSDGLLWPQAAIIREQVQIIEVLVEEDIEILVEPELEVEQEILATTEESVEIVIEDDEYYVVLEDPDVIEVTVEVEDTC